MMISNLPGDLVEEILTRVPLKSTRAVRLTCKKWNALFKSLSFLKMRIDKEEAATRVLKESSRMIVLKDYNVYLTSLFVNENPTTRFQGKLSFLKYSKQVKISRVYHCEGLLLCILKKDTRVVVWNPYLGQTRWIEIRYTYRGREGLNKYSYAIGYENKKNKSCRTHKILRFINAYIVCNKFFWYEIYDFDSGLWKTLDDVTVPRDWYIVHCNRGVSVKGNTYWWATEKKNLNDHIICFDFTREKFLPFLRLPLDIIYPDDVILSCVGDEKLALFLEDDIDTDGFEIWITTKIDAKNVSWIKFMTLDTFEITIENFFVDEEKKVAMIFQSDTIYITGETGYFKRLDLKIPLVDKRFWPPICSYVPSLVQIKQQVGRKRKKQSDLEKQLYYQNMSRLVALEEKEKEMEAAIRRKQRGYMYFRKP